MKKKNFQQLLIDQQQKPRWHWVKANWNQICIWPSKRFDSKTLTAFLLEKTVWPFPHFRHIQTRVQRDGRTRFHIFVPPTRFHDYLIQITQLFPGDRVRAHRSNRLQLPSQPAPDSTDALYLKCLSWNCQTLNTISAVSFLIDKANEHKVDIIMAQETLRRDGSLPIRSLEKWKVFENPGSNTHHIRGILVAFNTSRGSALEGWQIENITPITCRTRLFFVLSPPVNINHPSIIVSTVYMDANKSSSKGDWNIFKSDLSQILSKHTSSEIIILGDFNKSYDGIRSELSSFLNRIKVIDYPLDSLSTWYSGTKEGKIDFAIVSKSLPTTVLIEPLSLSDHRPIISKSFLKCRSKPFKKRISPPRVIQNAEAFRRMNYYDSIADLADPEAIWKSLKDGIISCVNATDSWTKRETSRPTTISKHSLRILKAKRCAERTLRENRNEENLRRVRQLAKDLHSSIRTDRSSKSLERMINAIEPLQRNAHVIDSWAYIMNLFQTGKYSKSRQNVTSTFVRDHRRPMDHLDPSPDTQSEIWLHHFNSICGPQSVTGHPTSEEDWTARSNKFRRKVERLDARYRIVPNSSPSHLISHGSLDIDHVPQWKEIRRHIRRLGERKAPGEDQIIAEIFKAEIMNADEEGDVFSDAPKFPLGRSINHLIQQIWHTRQVPDEFKISIIAPIPKIAKPEFASDFRPISLIPVALKLLTSIIAERILKEGNSRLSNAQAGFRTAEECISQIISLHDCIKELHAAQLTAHVTFIDIKQAFDSVPHYLLFKSAKDFGIPPVMLDIIQNIYTGSKAKIRLDDGKLTPEFEIKRGVKQGDPLSPILFIIFMDSLVKLLQERNLSPTIAGNKIGEFLYADDIALLNSSRRNLTLLLKYTEYWLEERFMEANPKKCGTVTFTAPGSQIKIRRPLSFKNGEIPNLTHYKYLGVTFNESLSYFEMAQARIVLGEQMINKCLSRLASNSIPTALKKTIIKSVIIPTMTYGSQLWAQDFNARLLANNLLRKALNAVTGVTPNNATFEAFGIPTMEELHLRSNFSLLTRSHQKKTIFKTLMPALLSNQQLHNSGTWAEALKAKLFELELASKSELSSLAVDQRPARFYQIYAGIFSMNHQPTPASRLPKLLEFGLNSLRHAKLSTCGTYSKSLRGRDMPTTERYTRLNGLQEKCKSSIQTLYPLTTGVRDVLNILTGTFYTGRMNSHVHNNLQSANLPNAHDKCIHCQSQHQETLSHLFGHCHAWDRQRKVIWGTTKLATADLDALLCLLHREPSGRENVCNNGLPLLYDTLPARDNSFYENFIHNVSKSNHVFAKVAAFLQLIGIKRRKERREVFKPTLTIVPQPPPPPSPKLNPTTQIAQKQARALLDWLKKGSASAEK